MKIKKYTCSTLETDPVKTVNYFSPLFIKSWRHFVIIQSICRILFPYLLQPLNINWSILTEVLTSKFFIILWISSSPLKILWQHCHQLKLILFLTFKQLTNITFPIFFSNLGKGLFPKQSSFVCFSKWFQICNVLFDISWTHTFFFTARSKWCFFSSYYCCYS